jgi:hypothetical protein
MQYYSATVANICTTGGVSHGMQAFRTLNGLSLPLEVVPSTQDLFKCHSLMFQNFSHNYEILKMDK